MERTGGEPDVLDQDKKTGEYIFYDCTAESPKGRRSLCYDREALDESKEFKPEDSAIDRAAAMGIELLTEEQYRELQKLGNFDTKTSSWVTINVDSILRLDSLNSQNLFKNKTILKPLGSSFGETIIQTTTVSSIAYMYERYLNDGAWTVYTFTSKPIFLSKALLWAKRAIEFKEEPEVMDTYARLLYKTGNVEVAIIWETKAIEAKRINKLTSTEYEKVLNNMKRGFTKIDEF